MAALTWQNVATPAMSGVAAMGKVGLDATQAGFKGIADAFTGYADNKRESNTNKAIAELQSLNGLENFGQRRANIVGRYNPENMDMALFGETADARRTMLDTMATNVLSREESTLNNAYQGQKNLFQGEVHESDMDKAAAEIAAKQALGNRYAVLNSQTRAQMDATRTDRQTLLAFDESVAAGQRDLENVLGNNTTSFDQHSLSSLRSDPRFRDMPEKVWQAVIAGNSRIAAFQQKQDSAAKIAAGTRKHERALEIAQIGHYKNADGDWIKAGKATGGGSSAATSKDWEASRGRSEWIFGTGEGGDPSETSATGAAVVFEEVKGGTFMIGDKNVKVTPQQWDLAAAMARHEDSGWTNAFGDPDIERKMLTKYLGIITGEAETIRKYEEEEAKAAMLKAQ